MTSVATSAISPFGGAYAYEFSGIFYSAQVSLQVVLMESGIEMLSKGYRYSEGVLLYTGEELSFTIRRDEENTGTIQAVLSRDDSKSFAEITQKDLRNFRKEGKKISFATEEVFIGVQLVPICWNPTCTKVVDTAIATICSKCTVATYCDQQCLDSDEKAHASQCEEPYVAVEAENITSDYVEVAKSEQKVQT